MIEKKNLDLLFAELDELLSKQSMRYHLIIYGGAALIANNILDRVTVDIDVFEPQLDKHILAAIKEIAKRHMFDDLWINSTGNAFKNELPKNWKTRLLQVFKGTRLTISTLGRIDLIFTKFLAELDRQEDLEDLKSLNPTVAEIKEIRTPLLELENDKQWKEKVIELLNMFESK
ncbi:MAG: hypothetical protein HOO06_14370 [Bdellovibrionaceae bacterium]|jgi:hypothetical protein|nr:hypothetical protein [Pseudobdellovibrionaceae bacterium]